VFSVKTYSCYDIVTLTQKQADKRRCQTRRFPLTVSVNGLRIEQRSILRRFCRQLPEAFSVNGNAGNAIHCRRWPL